jgi:hypothetical protein
VIMSNGNRKGNSEKRSISPKYEDKLSLAGCSVVCIIVSVTYMFSIFRCNSFIRCPNLVKVSVRLGQRLHGLISPDDRTLLNNAVRFSCETVYSNFELEISRLESKQRNLASVGNVRYTGLRLTHLLALCPS